MVINYFPKASIHHKLTCQLHKEHSKGQPGVLEEL
jgi:hypothetical protein